MLKKFIGSMLFLACSSAFAMTPGPTFDFLPNIKATQLKAAHIDIASLENEALELVKKTLKITASSPYQSIRIRFIYNEQNKPQALLVYLLSSKFKSFEIVRIDLTNNFKAASVIENYRPTAADYAQDPHYAMATKPTCPDSSVQFVIGNNFNGDPSVEQEVRYVYQLAKDKGYNPVLMDINDKTTQQPTIEAYKNWMSCPNVKGFYNEAHGSPVSIMLSDGELTASIVEKELATKLTRDVVLFDSCSTFNDPMLAALIKPFKGNAQQYMGGIIPLPFGPSERTASCFWTAAMNNTSMTQNLIIACAKKSALDPFAFRISNKFNKKLRPAT